MERTRSKSTYFVRGILNNLSSNIEKSGSDGSFRIAVFNGVTLIVVFVILITITCVYMILNPFVKPLLWALLCGSVLHPFKLALSLKFTSILETVESSQNTSWNLLFWPFTNVIYLADYVGDKVAAYWKILLNCTLLILSTISIYYFVPAVPSFLIHSSLFCWWIVSCVSEFILTIFSSILIVGSLIVSFSVSLILFWDPLIKGYFKFGCLTVWVAISAYVCGFFPYLRIPFFLFLHSSVFGCYFLLSINDEVQEVPKNDDHSEGNAENDENEKVKEKKTETITKASNSMSIIYIRYLFIIVLMFHFLQWLFIIPVLLAIYGTKIALKEFGIAEATNKQLIISSVALREWFNERRSILLPTPIEHNFKIIRRVWKSVISSIKQFCDSFAAVAVILCLLLFLIFISVFIAFQAYREGVYLVQTGGSIINSTIVHNPELHHLLPEDWESTLDIALNNTYIYIREALANFLRGLLKDKGIGEVRSVELEKNVLELWDRAYQAWVVPLQPNKINSHGPSVSPDAVHHSFQRFIDALRSTPEVASLASLGQFISDNMATLTSSLDSVWIILKGNMSLLLSLLSTIMSIVFGGSMSLINFLFNMVVFLTALFYLLSTSREMYKPVELITGMSPVYGNKLAVAVEKACQGVLVASTKLSLFYLMWTWLIHTLFQCNFVYMPALFAGVLGVVPVLGSYWSCLPAVLDLWLVQDAKILALGLLIAQFLPTFIIDSTIYNEMRGGHPYLTGLSVAGGIFWLGLEGAIIGPLFLCFLFVIVNIITDSANQSEDCRVT